MDRKMNYFIMFFIFITTLIFTSNISYSQTLITGSTIWGTETVTISPDMYTPKISELLRGAGLDEITCKFITLDGKNNEIKIDVPFISSKFDLDTEGDELKAGLEVGNLFISSSEGEEYNWVDIEGKLGGHEIRFELSFKSGFKAITGSTVQDPNKLEDTTFRIRLFNKGNNSYKTLFEKSTSEWKKISVNNYIKDNIFPDNFEVYLNSLQELDNYEIEFITLLERLTKDRQIYYAEEVYNAGFNQTILQQLKSEIKNNEILGDLQETNISIINITPSSRLQDDVLTDFQVEVEYNLVGFDKAKLMIGFNNGDIIKKFFMISNVSFIVNEGSGKYTFNVNALTKNWETQGDFLVYVNISEYPHPSTWKPLDSDRYALTFY
ncbi:hypothetical protein ES695_18405 [Candidatus Atribacteria bacterium 1244-E10-H5-B2]|nr:MAG: hypothetical protein ES695_18405 [Candidatus Atribacteria bacterium 1244-E10-H5-B2]